MTPSSAVATAAIVVRDRELAVLDSVLATVTGGRPRVAASSASPA